MEEIRVYSKEEVVAASNEYFNGDDLAANVFLKYALRKKHGEFLELTPEDMHERLAGEFARMEHFFGGEKALTKAEILEELRNFKKIVPQGSPMSGIGNDYQTLSLSNCVVVDSPADTMTSIMDAGKDLANLFKRRCGVGVDISNLRPEGALVENAAGTSTGAWSFADFYSYVCRMVGQNNRRGALMISIDVRHPDIEQFVTMKEDLQKVTGANVSVRLSDDFMEAVEADRDFQLRFPVEGPVVQISRMVSARKLWDLIVKTATKTAEPGLLFWDNVTKYLPAHCYSDVGYKTICVNPCAEISLSAYDSCRLISINLKNFVVNPFTKDAKFDYIAFEETVRKAMRLSDDLVELECEKLEKLIAISDTASEKELFGKLLQSCFYGRRTGLGTHGLADCLARLGLRYDSDAAIKEIDLIYGSIKINAYDESVELAKERGPFPVFDWETEKDCAFYDSFPSWLLEKMAEHGRRNISILTCAPTGSVSIESQTSSGVEPVFRLFFVRRVKMNHDDHREPDFVDDMGDRWIEYKHYHKNAKEYLDVFGGELPDYFVTSDQIDWVKRVEVQAAMQRHIDHSISSTINLPKGTKPEVVKELYFEAWKQGLKGVTVYVDGSRTGVLVSEIDNTSKFEHKDAAKRPSKLKCDVHPLPQKKTALVGLLDGKPYEVMVLPSGSLAECDLKEQVFLEKVKVYKTRETRYDLHVGDHVIKEIQKQFDLPDTTRLVSGMLRHGAKAKYVVEQLQKGTKDFFSNTKNLARVLKKYIDDGEKVTSTKLCPECGSEDLAYQEGCETCMSCGYAKCG